MKKNLIQSYPLEVCPFFSALSLLAADMLALLDAAAAAAAAATAAMEALLSWNGRISGIRDALLFEDLVPKNALRAA